MDFLFYILTGTLILVALPFLLLGYLISSNFRKYIREKIKGANDLPYLKKSLWIHASSVGEVRLAKTLINSLQEHGEIRPIVLSTFTPAGFTLAMEENLPHVFRLPFDFPLWLNPVFNQIMPSQLILIEAELWPSLLRICKKKNIPVLQVNGRLSEKSFERYKKFNSFFLWVTEAITLFSMRSQKDAKRLFALGVSEEKVRITDNIKFDIIPTGSDTHDPLVFNTNSFLIVFGSTRPGDEGPAMEAFLRLKKDFPNLLGVIAPRHLQRCREVEDLIQEFNVNYTLYSEAQQEEWVNNPCPIILLDKIGILNSFYAKAKLAYVGGGFNPRFGGQNILEPAAFATPVLFGKHMNNFEEEARLLVESGGGIQLQKEEELYSILKKFIMKPKLREKAGRAASETVRQHRGAIRRTLEVIQETHPA